MNKSKVLILGSGSWHGVELLPKLAEEADYIIAADGGWRKSYRFKINVDHVIGDLDSLSPQERLHLQTKTKNMEIITHPVQKEMTDLELALDRAMALKAQKIVLFGVLGGRLDQTLANIFILEKAVRCGIQIEIIHGRTRLYPIRDRLELTEAKRGDLLSLIPISARAKGLRTWGLKYKLEGEDLKRASSRGISNEVVALPAGVELAQGLLLVIHLKR